MDKKIPQHLLFVNITLILLITLCSGCAGEKSAVPASTPRPPADTWINSDPSGSVPTGRDGHAMAYNSDTHQVVLFGGKGKDYYNDTWAYNSSSKRWTELKPTGPLPPARFGQALVYDPTRQKVILSGGVLQSGHLTYDDTWAYDPDANTWSDLNPGGSLPPWRTYPAMVSDPSSGNVILFGGWTGNDAFSDTWAYNPAGNTWTQLNPASSPPARWGHSMVYVSAIHKVILFGGLFGSYDGSSRYNDTWAYDPVKNTWSNLNPGGSQPPGRAYAAMIYAEASGKVILFGGFAGADGLLTDTWVYDPIANTWARLNSSGDQPLLRDFSAMVYDTAADKGILFGGLSGETGNINGTLVNNHPLKQVACPWRYTRKTRQCASETFGRSTTAHKPEGLRELQANA